VFSSLFIRPGVRDTSTMLSREYRGVAFAAFLFLLVQLGALALVPTFFEQGYQPVEDPQDPTNSVVYFGAILVATALMLVAFKYDLDELIRLLIVGVSGLLAWYVFGALLPTIPAVALALGVAAALLAYPEWYVIDTAGVLMGAGAAGLFGISFGLLPALVLLTVLAVYDAVSVYGTEHMLDLAEGVMDLKIPVVLVIPTTLSYSLRNADFSDAAGVHEDTDENRDDGPAAHGNADGGAVAPDGDGTAADSADDDVRDVFFVGLGDAVIPAVLVASAAFFLPTGALLPGTGLALTLPALTAMLGTLAGLVALVGLVARGRAHAGLPLLNGGAVVGYLLGATAAGVPPVQALGLAPYL